MDSCAEQALAVAIPLITPCEWLPRHRTINPCVGHEDLGRIHRKFRRRVHDALLATAGAEDHSREANSGNLAHHASPVHCGPRAMVDLWTSFDELAAHNIQPRDTYTLSPTFNPTLPLPHSLVLDAP